MGGIKLSVVLMVVFMCKCLAMSYNELEDFADYLKKTSQLSPTLKKGVEPDDYDEDEVVSDHAWEESGKFEGDLILNERQRRLIVEDVAEGLARNGIQDGTKRWPNNEVIFYIQKEHFTSDQTDAIRAGIEDLARASCVKFRPYRKGDRDAVVIQGSRRGCFSQVGYQGGYQVLNLSGRHSVGRGCFRHGTVVHELLHTLGFYHMQSSPDRDDYVNIVWSNIVQPARHNFRKYNSFSVSDFGVGYDYDSVLHYSRRAFSSNGQDTIIPKQSGANIGQRVGLSDKDSQKLNKMYCDADSDHAQADDAKKTKKNKPFDGHGIGYHQGKAVAIKLLPAPETYKIGDVPSFHIFDYFSKTPEILPSSEIEGFRIGKEIAYSFNPVDPPNMQIYKAIQQNTIPDPKSHELNTQHLQDKNQVNIMEIKEEKPDYAKESYEISNTKDTSSVDHDDPRTEQAEPEINDAFDTLSKIIKTHVYPSQNPDLSIYKPNENYEYYNAPTGKIAESYPLSSPIEVKDYHSQQENADYAVKFIDKLFHRESDKPNWSTLSENLDDRRNANSKTENAKTENVNNKLLSLTISLPVKKQEENKQISTTAIRLSEHNPDEDYTKFYSPKDYDENYDGAKYTYNAPKYDYGPRADYVQDYHRGAHDYYGTR